MKILGDSASNVYGFGDYSLYMGAVVSWTGNSNVSAGYGQSIAPTSAAWSTAVSVGDTAVISYTLPPYYTADFSASGLVETGSSISGKTVTVTGIIENDVDFGFSNYRENTFSASSNIISVVDYSVQGYFPAYAFVFEFPPSAVEPSYSVYTLSPVTIHDAWYDMNYPLDYEVTERKDVTTYPYSNAFEPPVESATVNITAEVPYNGNPYTGTKSSGVPVRYRLGANGLSSLQDWWTLDSVNPYVPGDYKITVTASTSMSAWNPCSWLYGWFEQASFSSEYRIKGSISATAVISGYIR